MLTLQEKMENFLKAIEDFRKEYIEEYRRTNSPIELQNALVVSMIIGEFRKVLKED